MFGGSSDTFGGIPSLVLEISMRSRALSWSSSSECIIGAGLAITRTGFSVLLSGFDEFVEAGLIGVGVGMVSECIGGAGSGDGSTVGGTTADGSARCPEIDFLPTCVLDDECGISLSLSSFLVPTFLGPSFLFSSFLSTAVGLERDGLLELDENEYPRLRDGD